MKKAPAFPLILFALLPVVALAVDVPADEALEPQTTDLAPVRVDAEAPRTDAAVNTHGQASLRDTPASIAVVTRERIDAKQIRNLSELAREDASLGDNYAPVGYYQNIAIRGYPLDLATGYRLNNLAMAGEQRMAFENKQRVEVLKGLAALAAGVIEPGGVVNYVTKRPDDVRRLTLGTDSHGSRYVALDAGAWLTPDFGVRANVAWENEHAWVRHADGRRNFYALAADWHITPDATLELDTDYQSSAQRSVSGYQLLGGHDIPVQVDRRRMLGYQPWQEPVAIHSANTNARFTWALDSRWRLRAAAGHSRSVVDDHVAFAYGCYYVAACADGSVPGNFFAPDGGYDIYDYRKPDDERVTEQARASLEGELGDGVVRHELSLGIGAFHHYNHGTAHVNEYVGSANIHDVEPPVFAPSPLQPGPSVRRVDAQERTLTAMDRMHLGNDWQLVLGASRVRLHDRGWSSRGDAERDVRLTRTLPQAAVLWQPNSALTTYASYSEGISLSLEAPFWTSNEGQTLGPRLSRQVEAGAKFRWRDALDLGVALFRIHQPYQFAQPDDSDIGYTFVQRGEEVHDGVEFSAEGRLTDALGVHANASLIRARAEHTGTPLYEDHQVVNVPRLRAGVALDYRLPWRVPVEVSGGWRHVSSNPATPDGRVRVPAYDVFDAGLRWRSAWREHALVWRLGIDNVFDRFYWRDTGSSDGDRYLFPGSPRLARLTVEIAL